MMVGILVAIRAVAAHGAVRDPCAPTDSCALRMMPRDCYPRNDCHDSKQREPSQSCTACS
jgi:hypothetical protein